MVGDRQSRIPLTRMPSYHSVSTWLRCRANTAVVVLVTVGCGGDDRGGPAPTNDSHASEWQAKLSVVPPLAEHAAAAAARKGSTLETWLSAVSVDGKRALAGSRWSDGDDGDSMLTLWTPGNDVESLGSLDVDQTSGAYYLGAVTPDLTSAIGKWWSPSDVHAFRWTEAGGMVDLNLTMALADIGGMLQTDDGSQSFFEVNDGIAMHIVRYRDEDGAVDLGRPENASSVSPVLLKRDGSALYGVAHPSAECLDCIRKPPQPFRWTAAVGFDVLALPEGTTSCYANGIYSMHETARGVAIASTFECATGSAMFLWTEETGWSELGAPDQAVAGSCVLQALSKAGDVAFGTFLTQELTTGFWRWSVDSGLEVPHPPDGSAVLGVGGISEDGSVFVGWAEAQGQIRGYRWSDSGRFELLEPVAGEASSVATGFLSDGAWISGDSYTGENVLSIPTLWDVEANPVSLADLVTESDLDLSTTALGPSLAFPDGVFTGQSVVLGGKRGWVLHLEHSSLR